jgi:7,8-dihydropterin-6-yl-methyl-4-(beta-D-ribofuranosyl)aminobenzene 5'-phosphate synthase
MIIKALVENTSCIASLGMEHGLSLFIEANGKRILFDTGSSPLFSENAKILGVDLKSVDFAVISHGHFDHGGGLETFISLNPAAKIYIRENAFDQFYSDRGGDTYKYIGLDMKLSKSKQMVFTKDQLQISEGISLFSGVTGNRYFPSVNSSLYKKEGNDYIAENFSHEQNLVIEGEGVSLLVAGCAHRGIVNILQRFFELKGCYPTHVIGGFHLLNKSTGKRESDETLLGIAKFLKTTNAKFYTCHCTGEQNFAFMHEEMGDQIEYLSGGTSLTIGKSTASLPGDCFA